MTEKEGFLVKKLYMVSKYSRKTISTQNSKGSPHLVPEVWVVQSPTDFCKIGSNGFKWPFNPNNFWRLDFFAHKVNLFFNQYKISRRLVYNMTTFCGTAKATIFYAQKGVPRVVATAHGRGTNIFRNFRSYITRIKRSQLYAVSCIRKFPQRLE